MKCEICRATAPLVACGVCAECFEREDMATLVEAFEVHQDAETQWAQQLAQCEREHDPQSILRKDWTMAGFGGPPRLIRAVWLIDRS